MLEIKNLTKRFRGLIAVNDLSFEVQKGEILGLVGPNGAGKTTVFNSITGFYPPTSGKIVFNGCEITGKKPSKIAAFGLVRTFQSNALFNDQSCFENVMIAHHLQWKSSVIGKIFSTSASRRDEEGIRQHTIKVLERTGLVQVCDQIAGNLPNGLKRVLGIAIALSAEPKLLLLDEPVAGVSHHEAQIISSLIKQLNGEGLSFVLVEHNMRFVMDICNRIIVLNFGCKIAEDLPNEIACNKDVIDAYFGGRVN
ncbi:MAG: ABC transporter ATP-binding protein [Dehalococcoidia bacterium]|nr:ABC transporter ATP-binding protein [Dehalococcoidia bacterium]